MLKRSLQITLIIAIVLGAATALWPTPEADAQTGGLLVARHSNKCLDIKASSTSQRAPAQQFTCHGNTNQQWQLVSAGNGYYNLVAAHSGQCLDVRQQSKKDRAQVQQYPCSSQKKNQQWQMVPVSSDGSFLLVARHSGKCLDVRSGSTADQVPVQQYSCHGRTNQRWIFQ